MQFKNHVIIAKGKAGQTDWKNGCCSWSDYNTSVFYCTIRETPLEKGFTEYHEEMTVLKAGVHEIDGQKIKVEKDIKVLN